MSGRRYYETNQDREIIHPPYTCRERTPETMRGGERADNQRTCAEVTIPVRDCRVIVGIFYPGNDKIEVEIKEKVMREPRVYGAWAGNEKGRSEDPERCIERVASSGSWITHQCYRKRGHGKDGLYCKQHAKMRGESDEETKS